MWDIGRAGLFSWTEVQRKSLHDPELRSGKCM
jgi:hypothetical protein